ARTTRWARCRSSTSTYRRATRGRPRKRGMTMADNTVDPSVLSEFEERSQGAFVEEDEPWDSRMTINMGPQHPSTHGVLRLVLELEGEIVREVRPVIGYLHTGMEKECEDSTWRQAVTIVTRMDYLAP